MASGAPAVLGMLLTAPLGLAIAPAETCSGAGFLVVAYQGVLPPNGRVTDSDCLVAPCAGPPAIARHDLLLVVEAVDPGRILFRGYDQEYEAVDVAAAGTPPRARVPSYSGAYPGCPSFEIIALDTELPAPFTIVACVSNVACGTAFEHLAPGG